MSKVAVVTGGASGMGEAICRQLAGQGFRVAVLDLNPDAAEQVAVSLQTANTLACDVDVADEDSVAAAFSRVREAMGPVSVLVTSAAITDFTPFEDVDLAAWQRMLDVNLTGTFLCAKAALPDMEAAGWGRIVTLASYAGQHGSAGQSHYAASKGGVISLTKTLSLEYAAKGITANVIAPFAVDTPMLRDAREKGHLGNLDAIAKAIPAGRMGTPGDIANTCAFLCSDSAAYITGQVLAPTGGVG